MNKNNYFLLSLFFCTLSFAKDELEPSNKEGVEPLRIGNFSLSSSQTPSPLYGFGQNIIDQGDLLGLAEISYTKGRRTTLSELELMLLYGVTDNLSLFILCPIALSFKANHTKSHGVQDIRLQGEYVIHKKNYLTAVEQVTLVANVTAPTGCASCALPTGFGAPSFFLGFTANLLTIDWYFYTAQGTVLTTSHKEFRSGRQFLYQFGIGRNIPTPPEWIFLALVELFGEYIKHNSVKSATDKNSGGNIFFVAPSLFLSNERFIFHLGAAIPVSQHLFGNQTNNIHWNITASFMVKFN